MLGVIVSGTWGESLPPSPLRSGGRGLRVSAGFPGMSVLSRPLSRVPRRILVNCPFASIRSARAQKAEIAWGEKSSPEILGFLTIQS